MSFIWNVGPISYGKYDHFQVRDERKETSQADLVHCCERNTNICCHSVIKVLNRLFPCTNYNLGEGPTIFSAYIQK